MDKALKIRLHVLSPIHIGCDDVYEPTSFVIDEQKKKLIEFDPLEFVKHLKPQEMAEFSKTAAGDNLLAIFKAIKRFYKPSIKGREVEITDYLVSHYKKILSMGTFDKNAVINQFTMHKTAFNPQNNMPYIPGSSLKGSLRTAYLSALANIKKITGSQNAKTLETDLLNGNFATDPFRMVKVSDLLPVGNVKTKILYAINRKKQKSDKTTLAERGGVNPIFEVIQPGAVFEGIININKPINGAGISKPVTAEELLLSSHKFYAGNLKQEIIPLNDTLGIRHKAGISANEQFKDKFKRLAFLIRIGRHSGAEAVTIEGNRKIKIMQGRGETPKFLDHATIFWLASDSPRPQNNNSLIPFGWAVLEVA
jgi:CRISPR-associated protein Csm5